MSMFDKEFMETEGETEVKQSEEATEEDVELASMGIASDYAQLFRRHNKNKKIFHPSTKAENLTKQFFKFYLQNCDNTMLGYIIKKKLSKSLQIMLSEAKPVELEIKPEFSTIEQYIEKNAELIQEIVDLKEKLGYLYTLLGMNEKFFDEVKITDEILDCLKQIKEVL